MKHQHSQSQAIAHALDHAQLALAGNLLEPALQNVREALRLNPDHPEARLLEARIRLRRHEPRLALTALDNRQHADADKQESTPPRPDVAMLRATALSAAGQIDMAVMAMETLANEFPDDAGVLRALAGMQVHDGRHADAAETLGRICELDPQDRSASRLRAELLQPLDPAEALEALGHIDNTNRHQAAKLCLQTQRYPEAESHYEQLLKTMDAEGLVEVQTYLDAAEVAELMGENQKAVDRLSVAGHAGDALAPSTGNAWRSMGQLHLNAGRIGQAARAYRRATRLMPTDADAWAGLVTCAHLAGRKHLVAKADRKLRALVSRSERRRLLAELVPHTTAAPTPTSTPGNTPGSAPENAGQVMQEAAAQSPMQRMIDDASATLTKVAAQFPKRADAHYHRAVCDAARGEFADANDWLTKAIKINPDYAAAKDMAERLNTPGLEMA